MSPAYIRTDVDVDTLEFRGRACAYIRAAFLFSSSSSFKFVLAGTKETKKRLLPPSPYFEVLTPIKLGANRNEYARFRAYLSSLVSSLDRIRAEEKGWNGEKESRFGPEEGHFRFSYWENKRARS